MSFRSRSTATRDGRIATTSVDRRRSGDLSPPRRPRPQPVLRSAIAGMACAAVVLYVSGWNSTAGNRAHGRGRAWWQRKEPQEPVHVRMISVANGGGKSRGGKGVEHVGEATTQDRWVPARGSNARGDARNDAQIVAQTSAGIVGSGPTPPERHGERSLFFDEADVEALSGALRSYEVFARKTLDADEMAIREGRPLQGKYIVLDTGNELANRVRGVLSGLFLGVLTDRVFVADITYQKDTRQGLLSALFEGPGYQWDLAELSPHLRHALAPIKTPSMRGAGALSKVLKFDMSEAHFQHWVCDDVLSHELSSQSVITLSTVVYPLPLIARNPTYASHPIIAGATTGEGGGWAGFAGGGQARIEALETLLTRMVLRPTREVRERARKLEAVIREKAGEWGRKRGLGGKPPRVVGLHVRTYFVKAVSGSTVETNLERFATCAAAAAAEAGGGEANKEDIFYFVATDEAGTQELARKVWGDGCFFVPFDLPGSKLEGMKEALVDLLVMGSLDDYVMTPHSSFSELGASLSYTWLSEPRASLRIRPNRPIVPFFERMNDFERRKVLSLLDRRASPVPGAFGGGTDTCMRSNTAGMSVAVAKGEHLMSMFEAIEHASCLAGRGDVAAL